MPCGSTTNRERKKDRNWLMVFEFAQNNLEYLDYLTNCIF